METQLWDMDTDETQIINPTLEPYDYLQFGVFLVDSTFCSKNWKCDKFEE